MPTVCTVLQCSTLCTAQQCSIYTHDVHGFHSARIQLSAKAMSESEVGPTAVSVTSGAMKQVSDLT
jgi:hypothetical protein